MTWQDMAVAVAGSIGTALAVAHGVILQRRVIVPIAAQLQSTTGFPRVTIRLLAPLLHVSTLAWLLGGLLLIATSRWPGDSLRLPVIAVVGALYLQAALANAIATRGRHFGWIPMAVAVVLLCVVAASGG